MTCILFSIKAGKAIEYGFSYFTNTTWSIELLRTFGKEVFAGGIKQVTHKSFFLFQSRKNLAVCRFSSPSGVEGMNGDTQLSAVVLISTTKNFHPGLEFHHSMYGINCTEKRNGVMISQSRTTQWFFVLVKLLKIARSKRLSLEDFLEESCTGNLLSPCSYSRHVSQAGKSDCWSSRHTVPL